jgi:hypothetical protein
MPTLKRSPRRRNFPSTASSGASSAASPAAVLRELLLVALVGCGVTVWLLEPAEVRAGDIPAVASDRDTGSPAGSSFTQDVMAVLSRAGCNLGTCHGNLNGKGDLFLSLRGQDPARDYLALTEDLGGRRINRIEPDQSLVLLKPSAGVPHQGGQRFTVDSLEYRILRDWIAAGAAGPETDLPRVVDLLVEPRRALVDADAEPIPLRVSAIFSDQSQRDVTSLTTFETTNYVASVDAHSRVARRTDGEATVIARYLDQQATAQFVFRPASDQDAPASWSDAPPAAASETPASGWIDREIEAKLAELRVAPRAVAPDSVFLRRICLDVLGRLPTREQAQEFLRDTRPDKRRRLVDQLLARPEFADQWALRWSDLLRNEEKLLDARGVERFHAWIRRAFAEGMPLDEFARRLVIAQGSTYQNPPANYYRALRDPLTRGETTARLLLGVRLECAKCHNHPFDRWTQDDYYDWATLFGRVEYVVLANERKDKFDQHEFVGEQLVVWKSSGEVENARTALPAQPRFLGVPTPVRESTAEPPRLEQFARWLTHDEPREFARAQANRLWYHCLGRGLVEPIDDFRATNPASHPQLLDELARELIDHDYDVRSLLRSILLSRAYQADWLVAPPGSPDAVFGVDNFAGVLPRRLTAEQLLDAQCQVLDTPAEFHGYPAGTRANQLAGVERMRARDAAPTGDERFLTVFGKPARLLSCECERGTATTLTQAFHLLNGHQLQQRLARDETRIARWKTSAMPAAKIVDELFWAALARAPSDTELSACTQAIERSAYREQAIEDLVWAVLNTKEFLFRP